MIALLAAAGLALAPAAPAAPAPQRKVEVLEQRFDPTQDIGIDQRLGEPLPLDARFRDQGGREVELGSFFGERPVVLVLVYYECPMLCSLVLNGLLDAARVLGLEPGADWNLVVISIDPEEDSELAAASAQSFAVSLGREGDPSGLHFLTGEQASIDAVASAAGFRYVYDEDADQFAHASAIMVATPDGRMSRYFYGVEYSARDLRLALVEASDGEVGTLADQVLLLCYQYDPTTGQYGFAIMTALRVFGGLTVIGIAGFVILALRRDRRAKRVEERPREARA